MSSLLETMSSIGGSMSRFWFPPRNTVSRLRVPGLLGGTCCEV